MLCFFFFEHVLLSLNKFVYSLIQRITKKPQLYKGKDVKSKKGKTKAAWGKGKQLSHMMMGLKLGKKKQFNQTEQIYIRYKRALKIT